MEATILEWLSAAGGVGIWIVAYVIWRLDKRISHLEVIDMLNKEHDAERFKLAAEDHNRLWIEIGKIWETVCKLKNPQ